MRVAEESAAGFMLSWWDCRGQDLGRIDSLIVRIVGLWGGSLCLHLKVLLEELRELQRLRPTPPSSLVIIPVDQEHTLMDSMVILLRIHPIDRP